MRIDFIGRNVDIHDALREQAENKLAKLDKYFNQEVPAKVTFKTQKNRHTCEITIFLPKTVIRAEETSDDFNASLDAAVSAVERQIRKYKTRLKNRYQDNETIRFDNFPQTFPESEEDVQSTVITKRKKFALRPMSEEEAMLQLELLNHNFFVYLDDRSEEPAILYKRKDGNYGVIEVER